MLNVKTASIKDLQNYKVVDIEDGKKISEQILKRSKKIHGKMKGLHDNVKWQRLADEHYDLRQVYRRILTDTGKLAIKRKRENNG